MAKNDPKWPKNDPKWPKMTQNDQEIILSGGKLLRQVEKIF